MGWKTFENEPPDREDIDVYIENGERIFWISQARWSREKKAIVFSCVDPCGDMKILLWRERHPEPRRSLINKATPVPFSEERD
jgi:hypothetical protein